MTPGPPDPPEPAVHPDDRPATWGDLLAAARDRLPDHEARRLVERVSGYDSGDLVLRLDQRATQRAAVHLETLVDRRLAGEPLQYVVGRWGFRTLDLLVDRRVLIPRPETEVVVEVALAQARRLSLPPGTPLVAVDLGTGSGAIGLSLAVELGAEVWATDQSADALAVAQANLAGVGWPASTRVRLAQGDWFAALPDELRGAIHLVVSNPPYVATGEALPREIEDWEPVEALRSGRSGVEALETIIAAAPEWLACPGVLVLEIAPEQALTVRALAAEAEFDEVDVRPDLTGRPRAVVARHGWCL